MAANILELDIPETDLDICIICLETLTNETQYSLPECGHKFHQNCIMHWFRGGNCKCPLCNNLGVNDPVSANNSSHRSWGWWAGGKHKYKMIRQYARKKGAPAKLKKEIMKLKKMEEKKRILVKEIKEFKTKSGVWKDLYTEWRKLRRDRWRLDNRIRRKKMGISTFNVIPIIIATKMTLES